MKVQVQIFGQLKDYFSDLHEVDIENGQSVAGLKVKLLELNASATEILDVSRWAIGDAFIELNTILTENVEVCILPPSSGG